ncbi:unnamed protein product [Notodromas monacha]|uniref:HOOK N-terminal domain-containing protein n=1 Tax=Notodromas monacha TaxID=399045 RepID=A0A7R9BEJ9_9CRUS|nr:unnamed protein product [Notodromas monacha]CAG0913932.1 unnamed protein product [Notodromas monacha]
MALVSEEVPALSTEARAADFDACVRRFCQIEDPLDSLITWVQSLYDANSTGDDEDVSYLRLTQGCALIQVFSSINQKPSASQLLGKSLSKEDPPNNFCARLRNLHSLIQSIQKFYKDVLGQIVVCRLPDCISLAKSVDIMLSEVTKRPADLKLDRWPCEMQQLLLLLLGCAVQCPQREDFINNIKLLDINVQHVIVTCIQQITDEYFTVWPVDWLDYKKVPETQREGAFAALVGHLRSLVDERDKYLQEAVTAVVTISSRKSDEVDPEGEESEKSQHAASAPDQAPSTLQRLGQTSPEYHHLLVELADTKGKLRRLRQEVEEKSDAAFDLTEKLEQMEDALAKLRAENTLLSQEARASKLLQDELDVMREKAARADQLESDVRSYREKMAEFETSKSREAELRAENKVLVETNELLEDQLDSLRSRQERMIQLEQEAMHRSSQIQQLEMEKEANEVQIKDLLEENSRLLLCARSQADESSFMLVELDRLRHGGDSNASLSEEMTNDTVSHLRRLELENQRLLSSINQLKEQHANETNKRVSDLEKEKARLSQKVDSLQQQAENETTKCVSKEAELRESQAVIVQMREDVETIKEHHLRQLSETEREKNYLEELVGMLRVREEQTKDTRLKQVQDDNRNLLESNQRLKAELSRLEFDRVQLEKLSECLKASNNRVHDLDDANARLKLEAEDLAKSMSAFKALCVKHEVLEEEHTKLQVEFSKLQKILDSMKSNAKKFDVIQEEHTALSLQNAQLLRKVDNLEKITLTQSANAQETKESLNWEISQLRAVLQATKVERSKYDEMELDLLRVRGENQKLSSLIDAANKRVLDLEKDKLDLESEHEKIESSLADYKATIRRLVELERNNAELEGNNVQIAKEKAQVLREIAKVKAVIESKDKAVEDASVRISTLEAENRVLSRDIQVLSADNMKIVSLEKELGELKQEKLVVDKTLASLRAELVNEKIRSDDSRQSPAALEVENTTLQAQAASLSAQNSQLQESTTQLIAERSQLNAELEERRQREKSLVADYDTLQKLHEQLSCDYEALQKEQTTLKSSNRILVRDFKTLQENFEQASRGQEALNVMKSSIEAERETLRQEAKSLSTLRAEHSRLKDDFRSLFAANKRLKEEYKTLQSDHKALRSDNSLLRLKQTELQGQLDSTQHKIATLELQRSKLAQQCDVLGNLNSTLDKERKHLMAQVSVLLSQYHDLLTQTLEDRNHFHNEEKNYVSHDFLIVFRDKLNDLRRQKEKLEEKIMEQYRRMENVSRRKSFGSALVRKVRKAGSEIMQKVPRASRSQERPIVVGGLSKRSYNVHAAHMHGSDATDSQDSASVASTGGSGSSGDDLLADLCRDEDTKSEQFETSSAVFPAASTSSSSAPGNGTASHRHSMPCLSASVVAEAPPRKTSQDSEAAAKVAASKRQPGSAELNLGLGRPGTRRAVYYSEDGVAKGSGSIVGSDSRRSPKVLRSAKGFIGKARMPDPEDWNGSSDGGGNAGTCMPSGTRQSPIGMAQSTPEPPPGADDTVSTAEAVATSTPLRTPTGAAGKSALPPSVARPKPRAPSSVKSALGTSKGPSSVKSTPCGGSSGDASRSGGSDAGGSDPGKIEKKPDNSVWYEYGCV